MEGMRLKQCPCCGGDAMYKVKNFKNGKPEVVFAYCKECGLNTGFQKSIEDAAERWNRRDE